MFNKRRFKDNFSGTWSARNKKVHMLLKSVCYKITNARVVQNHKITKNHKVNSPTNVTEQGLQKKRICFFRRVALNIDGQIHFMM